MAVSGGRSPQSPSINPRRRHDLAAGQDELREQGLPLAAVERQRAASVEHLQGPEEPELLIVPGSLRRS